MSVLIILEKYLSPHNLPFNVIWATFIYYTFDSEHVSP